MREKREEGGGEIREEEKVSVVYLQYYVGLSCDYCTPDFKRDFAFLSLNIVIPQALRLRKP